MKTFIYGLLMLSLIGGLQISSVQADTDDTIETLEKALSDNDKEIEERKEKIEDLEDVIEKMRKEAENKLKAIKKYGNLDILKHDKTKTGGKTSEYKITIEQDIPKESKLNEPSEIEDYAEKVEEEIKKIVLGPCQNQNDATDTKIDTSINEPNCATVQKANLKLAEEVYAFMQEVPAGADEDDKKKYLRGLYELLESEKEQQKTAKKLSEAFEESIDANETIGKYQEKTEMLEDLNCDLEEDKNHFAYMSEGALDNVNTLAQTVQQVSQMSFGLGQQAIQGMTQANQHTFNLMNWNYYSPFPGFAGRGFVPGYGQHGVYQMPPFPYGLNNFGNQQINIQAPFLPYYGPNNGYDNRNYQQMVWDA